MKKGNKKLLINLLGMIVIVSFIIGGFAFNELLNVDARNRLVNKISSYQIIEMNARKDNIIEEWKRRGIFTLSKKELINELIEVEKSAKEAKKELEEAQEFLNESKIEGAKYSKMTFYSEFEELLNKFETSLKNNNFKEIKVLKESLADGISKLINEEREEKKRIEEEKRKKEEELIIAKKKAEKERRKAEKLKKERMKRENNKKRETCENYTLNYIDSYVEAVNNNSYYYVSSYVESGSQADREVMRMIDSYYNNNKSANLIEKTILSSKISKNICKVVVSEIYTIYFRDKSFYEDEVRIYQKMEYTWIVDGEDGYYNSLLRKVKILENDISEPY